MHVLITGGAGFIGSHIARFHLDQGDKVHVVDDLSTGRLENIKEMMKSSNFIFDEADILVWDGLEKAAGWADRIYHMAAVVGVFRVLKEPIAVLATNIAGCERLLRAMHKSRWNTKLIIASTSEVYGNRPGNEALHEEMELHVSPGFNTRWNYSISKLADEAMGLSYARERGMDITVVRFFNVVGPNQTGKYGMVVPRFVKQAVANEPITVFGDGSQMRAFVDVRDVVRILDMLANNPQSRAQIVNVGSRREITIKALAELVKEHAKSSSKIDNISYENAYGGVDFEEIYHRKPELSKVKRLTDYTIEWSLEDTIDDLIARESANKGK
ncbi:MAG: NAD-dependent epimerase/dehydratase family protein [Thiovulaceae bacterium]|nr:NAD-dependent epimerase/dehydratase family protein [Sulfurimonadaceae bacterium]